MPDEFDEITNVAEQEGQAKVHEEIDAIPSRLTDIIKHFKGQ